MAAARRVYEENDNVDDILLNQISKYVFYENLWSLARDLGIPQTEISGMAEIKAPQEKIFKVLRTWNNRKTDFKVKDLTQEICMWQREGYVDRRIWASNIFSVSLLPQHRSTSNETTQETHVSPIRPAISDEEYAAFEKEQLDPAVWVPKICRHFNIDNLKLLKQVGKEQVTDFLGLCNAAAREALKSLFRKLRCLHVPSFELKTLTDLPDVMNSEMMYLTFNRDDDGTKCNQLVDKLECTIWKWHQSSNQSYEFLTCLAILSLFDFSLEDLSFNNLEEKEIETISTVLRHNFDELKTLKTIHSKQAFVLNIALSNPFDKNKLVPYILDKLADEISPKFTGYTGQNYDILELHKAVKKIITRRDGRELEEKAKSLSMHFNSIFSRKLSSSQIKEKKPDIKVSVESLLKDLGLVEYYPQKLTYSDVIKLTEDALKDVSEKPFSLPELPWYFLKRLIGLNSDIRETGSVIGTKRERQDREKRKRGDLEISFSWCDDSGGEDNVDHNANSQHSAVMETMENVMNSVNPLDLIYVIFLCADDFLRQELTDKMSKCQYAVPFILPSAEQKGDESKNTVLHWGLQAISRTYCEENGSVMTKNLLNVSCPLVF